MQTSRLNVLAVFWILCALEALICLAFLFGMPGESARGAVLGYSPLRWGLGAWLALGGAVAGAAGYFSVRRGWQARISSHPAAPWLTAGAGMLAAGGLYFVFTYVALTDAQVRGIFSRLMPLAVWMTLFSVQAFGLLFASQAGKFRTRLGQSVYELRRWAGRHVADLLALALLMIVCLALMLPVTTGVSRVDTSDYLPHVRAAQRMEESAENETPYFLYQLLIIAAHILFPGRDVLSLGIDLAVGFQLLTALTLFTAVRWALRRSLTGRPGLRAAASAALALGSLLAAPVNLGGAFTHNLYYGFIGMQVYHNPTVILLKPLALLLYFGSLPFFSTGREGSPHAGMGMVLLTAGLTLLGGLAKPNFIIAFLPAAGLLAGSRFLRGKPQDWRALLLGIFLPAVLLLGWQYVAAYTSESVIPDEAGITFAPLAVYARTSEHLLVKFILSVLFPLGLTAVFAGRARRDLRLVFAWLIFLFGAFYTYFFAESGVRLQDANFAWSGQVTLIVLFCAALVFWLQRLVKEGWSLKVKITGGLFALHVISGILWYAVHLIRPWDAWW